MSDDEDRPADEEPDAPTGADGGGGVDVADGADAGGGGADAGDGANADDRVGADDGVDAGDGADAGDGVSNEETRTSEAGDEGTPVGDVTGSPGDDGGGSGFLGNLKNAREQLGEAKEAFANARGAGELPRDEDDRVKLVCRRHAEKRAVPLDELGRPACYDEDHPDCRGCLEDVRDGSVETW